MNLTKWKTGLAYILIISYPLGCYSFSVGDIGFSPVNLAGLAAFLFLVGACLVEKKWPDFSGVGVLLLLYIVTGLIGTAFAENRVAALKGSIGYLTDNALVFFCILNLLQNREQIEKAALLFLAVGTVHLAMGFVEVGAFYFFDKMLLPPFCSWIRPDFSQVNYMYGRGTYLVPGLMQMFGLQAPNSASLGTELLTPTAIAIYATGRYHRFRYFFGFITVFLLVGIFFSFSRNALLGLGVLLTAAYCLYRLPTQKRSAILVKPMVIILLVMTMTSIFWFSGRTHFYDQTEIKTGEVVVQRTPRFLLERLNPFISKGMAKSKEYFTSHAKLAQRHGFDNCGFGRGYQNFDDFATARYRIKYGSHSNFILFLGDTGIWGLMLQILIAGTTILLGLATYLRGAKSDRKWDHLPLFLVAAFMGLVITGIVRTFYVAPHTFILMGLIARLYRLKPNPASPDHPALHPA